MSEHRDMKQPLCLFVIVSFGIGYTVLCFICRPSVSTLSEDAEIEPRTVTTSAYAVRRSSYSNRSNPHSARSHPKLGLISSTTRLLKVLTEFGS